MNIIDIYQKYYLPENLQMHMLRVAACSNLIIDKWNGPKLDKETIIRVSLLHDMGNIVKIPETFSNNENFIKIRRKYFKEYGTNDHEINLKIAKDEGLLDSELAILDGKRSIKNEETLTSDSFERKICAYCDQRVSPNGVVGLKERLEDAKQRYKNMPLSVWSIEEKANHLIECSLEIEKQIMQYCNIKPEDINDNNIESYIEKLKKYDIQNKKIRKAVRTLLIKEDKIIVTKYKKEKNKDYYDIPGGKIEDNESSMEASIREFKEETGIDIVSQKYKGNIIIEYPEMIFDIDIYLVDDYIGNPLEFEENYSMWINTRDLLDENKRLPCIEIINHLKDDNIKLKIYVNENHETLKVEIYS